MSSTTKDARWALATKLLLELTGKDLSNEDMVYAQRQRALDGAQAFLEILPESAVLALAEEWNSPAEDVESFSDVTKRRIAQEIDMDQFRSSSHPVGLTLWVGDIPAAQLAEELGLS